MEPAERHSDAHAARVKQEAAALGFDACGIARAEPIDPGDHLGRWLAQGRHAGMAWIERTKDVRQDPAQFLPGAASVVVVVRGYGGPRPDKPPHAAHVARYAWGRDYHRVLAKPIRALARFITALAPETACRSSVDTGPVMEKAWAVRAGLGWQGKHSLVIHERLGSWCVLGVVVTTLPLTPDAPAQDRCGACRRCIEACPTGALTAPGVLDARKCLAYHLVETRGPLPPDLAARQGAWIFGCDVCQEACPWSAETPPPTTPGFVPRPGQAWIAPQDLDVLDDDAFRARFQGTPLMRTGLEGLRNHVPPGLRGSKSHLRNL